MRPDRLSAYGYTDHVTPHLDRLAAEVNVHDIHRPQQTTPWFVAAKALLDREARFTAR